MYIKVGKRTFTDFKYYFFVQKLQQTKQKRINRIKKQEKSTQSDKKYDFVTTLGYIFN